MDSRRSRSGPVTAALAVCALAYALAVWVGPLRPRWPMAVLVGAVLVSHLLGRRDPGAEVERPPEVVGVFERLADGGFHVMEDVSLGHAGFPYLVVGPPGLFVLAPVRDEGEAEAAADTLTEGSERLSDRLGSLVDPVVVSLEVPEVPISGGVPVVPVGYLEEWLHRRRVRWTAARVETMRETVEEILGLEERSVV